MQLQFGGVLLDRVKPRRELAGEAPEHTLLSWRKHPPTGLKFRNPSI
jgi:hypothetical protein